MKVLDRRGFFKSAGTAAAIAALPTTAMAFKGPEPKHPDPLPGWFEEWKKACLAYEAHPTGEGPEADAISAEQFRLDGLISQTPATTKEGLAAKLDYALHEHSMFNVGIRQDRRDLELVESIRASVRELV